jgi:hypothetical protein
VPLVVSLMNSYQLLEKLEKFANLIATENPIIKNIRRIAGERQQATHLINALDQIVNIGLETSNAKSLFENIRNTINQIPLKEVFVGISNLEGSIDEVVLELGNSSNPFAGLRSDLESFNRSYDSFFQRNSYGEIINIVYSANSLVEDFETIHKFIVSLKVNLIEHIEYGEFYQEATIFLNSKYSYREFIQKLDAIQEIYSEICLLMSISESEFPLQIIKIESGSLFAWIFGEAKVIDLFVGFIKDTVSFFYRQFTNEGKIEALSKHGEALEKILALNIKLEEAGIDTSESKEIISKSSVIIATKLNYLLLGEPEIELNGELLSLDSNLKQKYLTGSRIYLLTESDPKPKDMNEG